jgi:methyl-accepting chemotaxis protein
MKTMEIQATTPNQSAEIELTRNQGVQVGETAETIALIAKEVAEWSEAQARLLEAAASLSNEMTASMSESTRQLESIATFVEEIVSSVNESSASVEEVNGNTAVLASDLAEIVTAIEENARSIGSVTATTHGMATSAEEVTAADQLLLDQERQPGNGIADRVRQ